LATRVPEQHRFIPREKSLANQVKKYHHRGGSPLLSFEGKNEN